MNSVSSRSLHIFLCHSSADKPAVRELYQRLRADGFDPWLDEEDLLPGQDWEREIRKAVRASDVVIVCLSRGSINKAGFVQKEVKFALDVADEQPEGAIFLIPLKLEGCDAPERLSRWQWVNLFESKGYERLARALHTCAESLEKSIVPISLSPAHSSSERNVKVQTWGGIEFVRIPAGKFLMGSKDDNTLAWDDEKPEHTVEISYDYWMARYLVTNEQFARFIDAAEYKFGQGNWQTKVDHPVVYVTWYGAIAYCKWLTVQLLRDLPLANVQVRLPTEAEWEKAARGEYDYEWPWGTEFDSSKCNSGESSNGSTTPVGAYSPQGDGPHGIADMVGNAWEWCHSLYQPYPYRVDDGRENELAINPRVLRGGSFNDHRSYTRAGSRGRYSMGSRDNDVGFRVVIALPFA